MLELLSCRRDGQMTDSGRIVITAVAVEKLGFPENWLKTDDQKCIRIRRKSFIGHPGATIFPCALGERVFQQPQLFATGNPVSLPNSSRCPVASLHVD